MATKEAQELLHALDLKRYKKAAPEKVLKEIFEQIYVKIHHFHRHCWEVLIELLAYYIVDHVDLTLASMNVMSPFEGLKRDHQKLYDELYELIECYVVAAKQKPWDHLGQIMTENQLGNKGLGQFLTPRTVTDMMTTMILGEAEKITKPTTVLDPCVGTGGFLLSATLLYPKAPIILFGIDIDAWIYRACVVNLALFSNHPFSITCADTLLLDPDKSGPMSKMWSLGNRWDPPDMTPYRYIPLSPFQAYMKKREE